MHRRACGGAARERGAAAVEFALLLPVLLLLVFGIIDFGRALNAQITLTQAAREGARLAAVGQPNVVGRTQAAAAGLNPVAVTVTACPPGAGPGAEAVVTDQLRVLVRHADRRDRRDVRRRRRLWQPDHADR